MDNIKFNQTGGFPLDTDILGAMQNAYHIFNQLGNLAGDKAIISGCVETGNNVSDGIIYLNGEILPFKGGSKSATIFIKEDTESRIFEDGATKPVIFKRYASFGSSTPEKTFAWADFKRIKNLAQLEVEKATTTALAGAITELNRTIASAKSEIQTKIDEAKGLINGHLGSTNNPHNITPEQVGILRVGSIHLGDIQGNNIGWTRTTDDYTITLIDRTASGGEGGDDLFRITFTKPLTTSNYNLLGSFSSLKLWREDNDISFAVVNKRTNGFDLGIREFSRDIQNVMFDFVIIKK